MKDEKKAAKTVLVSVDGKNTNRFLIDNVLRDRELAICHSHPDSEPWLVTDHGNELDPWWSDDLAFIFDQVDCRINAFAHGSDWTEGLEDFGRKVMMHDWMVGDEMTFEANGHRVKLFGDPDPCEDKGVFCEL